MVAPKESVPLPDPTVLTTEALHREIGQLTDRILERISHERLLTDAQFETVKTEFSRVGDKFGDLARRTDEQKTDTKSAVDAALSAAKEANEKSEASTTKQIDALATLLTTTARATDDKIAQTSRATDDKVAEVKERVTEISAQKQGAMDQRSDQRNQNIDSRAILASVVLVVLALITVYGFIAANKPS